MAKHTGITENLKVANSKITALHVATQRMIDKSNE